MMGRDDSSRDDSSRDDVKTWPEVVKQVEAEEQARQAWEVWVRAREVAPAGSQRVTPPATT